MQKMKNADSELFMDTLSCRNFDAVLSYLVRKRTIAMFVFFDRK